jgi:hypothetical protein
MQTRLDRSRQRSQSNGIAATARPRPRRDNVVLRTPESPVSETHVEQPVPVLMSGMMLWSAGVAAFLLVPVAAAALAASPLLLAGGFFLQRSGTGRSAADSRE